MLKRRVLSAVVGIVCLLSWSRTADSQIVQLWRDALPGQFLGIGHIVSATTLQSLWLTAASPGCGYCQFVVIDLSTGQTLATWQPGYATVPIQPVTLLSGENRWLADVDGDGRDEILCMITEADPALNGFAVLKYDFATQTLTPGAPPAEPVAQSQGFRAVPNPANHSATISFSVPARETATLEIFDVAGRSLKRVSVTATDPGEQAVLWNGTDESGRQVASGTYFYTVRTSAGQATKKVVFLH